MAAKEIKALHATVETLAQDKEARDKWIGIYIGIIAVMLAVCSMGGGNAAKDASRAHLEAANTWNFFQAKNQRRTNIGLMADQLELQLAADTQMPPTVRKAYEDKIKSYRDLAKVLTSDKKTNEGLDELWAKGKALEIERDIAMRKDPYFDWSQALLQIAIVLATVCLVSFARWLLGMSLLTAFVGTIFMFNGFTLAFTIPFIG
jgi:hypothetical protein